MQTNTTIRYLIHSGDYNKKKIEYIQSYSVGGKIEGFSKFGKRFQFLQMLKIHFPHD